MRTVVLILSLFTVVPAGADVSDSHREAVIELLVLMDAERTMMGGAEAMVDAMLHQNPKLRPYRDILLEWATRHITWENVQANFMSLYVEAYTEREIGDLIAFYKTPTGQKSIRLGPELMRKGAMIGAEVAGAHSAELRAMLEQQAAELRDAGSKGQTP